MKPAALSAVAPVLLVRDLAAAVACYRDQLGFGCALLNESAAFAMMTRDGLTLMLKQAADPKHVVPHWTVSPKLCSVYFWVSAVDDLHRELVARGARIDYGPCDQPYGCREFGVQDADGHDLAFGERI